MSTYNWQQPDWPNFQYDSDLIQGSLLSIVEKMGVISGKLAHLDKEQQTEALVSLMIEEAVKTSLIEGEHISRPDVRSSIKNTLGLTENGLPVHDKRAEGLVELMFDVRNTFERPLTDTQLFEWHLMLLSSSMNPNLRIATWRTDPEPMQIVSGHYGKWTVHFEAPPAKKIPAEMQRYIAWFNDTSPGMSKAIKFAPVRAAIAHLYFESIHPFDDGNGRIGRAIAEKALSQGFGYPVILSLSQAIEADKTAYYQALHAASKSNNITDWIIYFLNVVLQAQINIETEIDYIFKKCQYFDKYKDQFNERELKAIKRMIRSGLKGFEGGMTAKKYMAITGVSKATATRDLQHLHKIEAITQIGSGRNIRYELPLK